MPGRFLFLAVALSAAAFAQQAPDDVVVVPDVEYSHVGGRMAMDVVMPKEGLGPFPTVVCVHGGGFRAGTRESYLPLAYQLAERGYVAATVTYRLSPMAQFPAPVEDVKAAVRFLRANAARFRVDADRIGATGGSAGGHLVLMLGLTAGVKEFEGSGPNLDQSSAVQAVVNFYGPTDFTKSYEPGKSVDAAEVLPMFLGGDLEHNRLENIRASPLNWVTPDAPPILTVQGTKDRYVNYEHAVWITDRLKAAGVDAELETIEGADHGFKGAALERANQRLFAFFDKHLAKPPQQMTLAVADHGPNGEVVVMEWPSGKELRHIPNNHGHDVQILPNGDLLYTTGDWGRVIEVDPAGNEVWTFGPEAGLKHPIAAQRLPGGNTLVGDMVLGKVIEVTPSGKTVWEYDDPELGNHQMRSARRTPAGTTLIAVERLNKVIEVDKSGKIIWTFHATGGDQRFPYQAHRLPNGNTLIGLAAPGQIVQVNPAGEIVKSFGGEKMDLRMGWCSGLQPLPNGGVLVSDYSGRRLIELDADGNVVHQLRTGSRTIASVSMSTAK